jgi:hypothetical protein
MAYCDYSTCHNQRFVSPSGTVYRYCKMRTHTAQSPLLLPLLTSCLDSCTVRDCRKESYKNNYTGTRYPYCDNRTDCLLRVSGWANIWNR